MQSSRGTQLHLTSFTQRGQFFGKTQARHASGRVPHGYRLRCAGQTCGTAAECRDRRPRFRAFSSAVLGRPLHPASPAYSRIRILLNNCSSSMSHEGELCTSQSRAEERTGESDVNHGSLLLRWRWPWQGSGFFPWKAGISSCSARYERVITREMISDRRRQALPDAWCKNDVIGRPSFRT